MTLPKFLTDPQPNVFRTGKGLVLDFETSNLEKGSWNNPQNTIVLACWIDKDGNRKEKFGSEYEQQELVNDILAADFIVAHNIKFELGWLHRCGLDLHDVLCYDTMLGEWVLLANRANGLHNLSLNNSLTRRGLALKEDTVGRMIKKGVDPQNIPKSWLAKYCWQDVIQTQRLFEIQVELLAKDNLLHIQYCRSLTTPVLADMERRGVFLDKDLVKEVYDKTLAEYEDVNNQMFEFAQGEVNWNSPKQVGDYLYDELKFKELSHRGKSKTTSSGNRAADMATILQLKATTKKQKLFQELFSRRSKLNAALTKNLNFFKGVCDLYDCVFYGEYNQGTTKTHRLSGSGKSISIPNPLNPEKSKSAGAQLQNVPRDLKKIVRARLPGWEMFEADGSQLEFRVAAELTRDKQAFSDIINDEDVHAITAAKMTEYGQPTTRQEAKSRTFRPLIT